MFNFIRCLRLALLLRSHHPDHDVGEGGDPQGGGGEGQHEPVVPAWRGTVGDGEVQQQAKRPSDQPLQLIAHAGCKPDRKHGTPRHPGTSSSKTKLDHICCLLLL